MTKDEALKQALEALENISTALREEDVLGSDIELMLNAAAAIRVALAQPEERTWLGLTDEEILQGNKESWVTLQAWQSAVWWAEAKLREKNS